jgi:hypothetical protein
LPALSFAVGLAVLRGSAFAATGTEEDSDEGNTAAPNRLIRTIATKTFEFLTAPMRIGRILGFFMLGLRVGLRWASFFGHVNKQTTPIFLGGNVCQSERLHLNSSKLAVRVRLTGERLF